MKPTAKEATFIHGKSFHPLHVFKGIILSEAKRLRMLNETDNGYQEGIKRLSKKCLKSGFKNKTVKEMIEKVENYFNLWNCKKRDKENIETNESEKKNTFKPESLTWTTRFKNILRFNNKEKELKPNAKITYRRPTTLAGMLTNYKGIAHNNGPCVKAGSQPCGKCALCGNWADHQNMVKETKQIQTKDKKIINLTQQIKCDNYGIYMAKCKICEEMYIGQTINSFSKRWNTHRKIWKEEIMKKQSENSKIDDEQKTKDEHALTNHYIKFHNQLIKNGNLKLSNAFTVIFVETPNSKEDLDMVESYWIARVKAKINIASTVLPKYM